MAGIDYLAFTTSSAQSRLIRRQSNFEKASDGVSQPGYESSEKWLVPGGFAWRKFKPRSRSKRFGLAYETWEASGDASYHLAKAVKGRDGGPSRLDVAFDFPVHDSVLADHVADGVRSHVEKRRLKEGVSGEAGRNTRYIGSRASERRIRIYRRDFKDETLRLEFPPLMRIELVLRKKSAKALWGWYRRSHRGMLLGASAHIRDMTGLEVMDDNGRMPPIERSSPSAKGAEKIYQWLKSNRVMLKSLLAVGFPLYDGLECLEGIGSPNAQRMHLTRLDEVTSLIDGVCLDDLRRLCNGLRQNRNS